MSVMAKAAKKAAGSKKVGAKAQKTSAKTSVKPKTPVRSKPDPRKASLAHQKVDAKTGEKQYGTRADLGAPVDVAINRMPKPLRTIAWTLDKEIRKLSTNIDSKVSWGHAGYWVEGHDLFGLCERKDNVSLIVGNGARLKNHSGLLEGTGKAMRHVKVRSVGEARSEPVALILKDALAQAKAGKVTAWDRMKKPT